MATYKKRGYKPKTEVEKQTNIEEESTTAEVFNTLDETASKTEDFVAKNQKYIFIIIGLVAVIVLGSLAYKEYVAKPKQQAAMNDMFQAQKYFDQAVTGASKDSLYNLALNGGEGKFGMLDIIEEYSGTPSANLANYYAGTAYLRLKDYKNAVKYLGEFKSNDEILAPLAKGNIGDAFVQLNQNDDALGYYEQAAEMRNNEFTTPMYLFKAGTIALELGKADKALAYFERIKNDYANSTEAAQVDVFIGKATVLANK
ncbi:tetratricopeptide repeat protein [Algibacter amylolyticus]|uniref:Tetratricopeptide repeat protein n=1 Tax=Algibacter amylolyticus TaxID=1608400 RepID=A0A5M7BCJ4_9FLAO|nr:tetratricopeptide repeat protein [Algibacter amylolyticus]KAA5825101.1 tetratricopeptide repeat protein [Algibacter amylolyticus]MBB5268792.1 tetratricopeptide (TPR) repeat protein [Algibacter amylolyticus]TSJ77595.1 tetratricopeptide repeat protein [Algibacter amylolyticus]